MAIPQSPICNVFCEPTKCFIYFTKLYTNVTTASHQVEWVRLGVIVASPYISEHFQQLTVHSVTVDEIKFLIMMTRLQNIKIKRTMFCGLVIFIKNFDPINIRRAWAPEITMFCNEVIMTKTFKPIKPASLGHPFNFVSFSARTVLVLCHPCLHLGCIWLDFTCFLKKQLNLLVTRTHAHAHAHTHTHCKAIASLI